MTRLLRSLVKGALCWGGLTLALYALALHVLFHAGWGPYLGFMTHATVFDWLGLGNLRIRIGAQTLPAHAVRAALAPYLAQTLTRLFDLTLLLAALLTAALWALHRRLMHPKNTDAFRRGGWIVTVRQLERRLHGWWPAPRQHLLNLGGVHLPRALETKHLLISGTTGAGKSTAFLHLLDSIRRRGERAIVSDPGGEFLSRFYADGDVILNPFDQRAPGWNLFNEIRQDYEVERLAQSLIPDAEGSAKEWHLYAQRLVGNVMRRLIERGDLTMSALAEWLTEKPVDELGILLTGLEMAQLAHAGNERMAANVRAICATYLSVFRYLIPGDFSIRNWMHQGQGWIFVPYTDSQFGVLKQLIATWMDIAVSSGLDLPPDADRRVWFLLDELDAMQQLPSLIPALTRLRKHGGSVVAGVQTVSQLRARYGRDHAQTLLANFSTRLILKAGDEETAELWSKELGQREVDRLEESLSLGEKNNSNSWKLNRTMDRLVLSTELRKLPDLAGYLDLSGHHPIARVTLRPLRRPAHTPPFLARAAVSLPPLELDAPEGDA